MGNGKGNHQIKPPAVNLPLPVARGGGGDKNTNKTPVQIGEPIPKHPKADGAVLFDKNWNKTQAETLRKDLTTLIDVGKSRLPVERESTAQRRIEQAKNLPNRSTEQAKDLLNRSTEPANNLSNRSIEQAKNLLNYSMDDLISLASKHKDLESFRSQPREFWSDVKKMSELRTVETFVNGKPAERVVSRYGDLVSLLNRSGERLETFVNSLPRGERSVFLARYQMSQTFGATESFVGRGIALDKNAHFPLDVFISSNGKSAQISVNQILSMLGGDLSKHFPIEGKHQSLSVFNFPAGTLAGDEPIAATMMLLEKSGIFANGQFLLNSSSAALLSLTLALYQNINAMMPFSDLAPEAFLPKTQPEATLPKTANDAPVAGKQQSLSIKNTFENSEAATTTARRAAGETLAAGALINGALLSVEQYRKAKLANVNSLANLAGDNTGFRFSAGATGAMMGATVGCVVPLAEKSVGEILGFASSVVVGLSDSGLRSLGANALVSVITSGVQTFLNVAGAVENVLPKRAANNFLTAAPASAEFYEDDLQTNRFSLGDETLLPA